MAHYVEVDIAEFEAFLIGKGFTRQTSRNEVVYVRESAVMKGLLLKVYTSGAVGEQTAREVGKDAIRVVAVLDKGEKSYPIYKGSRVYRTTSQESVQARTMERIEEAEARCAEWKAEQDEKRKLAPFPIGGKLPEPKKSRYVGEMGQELSNCLKVVNRMPWKDKFLFTLNDEEGNVYCYWTERDLLQVNENYDLRFKVVGHKVFKDVHQTTIADVFGKRVVQ